MALATAVSLDGEHLTIDDVWAVAVEGARAELGENGRAKMRAARELVELLVDCLTRGVLPVVPSRGSVGASGDLAPLAHLALPLVGEGSARVDGELLDGGAALARVGAEPVRLVAKEGL